jgi:hypothetical protein
MTPSLAKHAGFPATRSLYTLPEVDGAVKARILQLLSRAIQSIRDF